MAITMAAVVLLLNAPGAGLRAAPTRPPTTTSVAPGARRSGPADDRAIRRRDERSVESKRLPGVSNNGGWLRTLGALAIVVALIFAARFALKRWGRLVPTGQRGQAIEVLTEVRLASRQRLALVRLGRRLVLIGSGPTGMNTLAEVSDPAEAEELLAGLRAGARGTFGSVLARYSQGGGEKDDGTESPKGPETDKK